MSNKYTSGKLTEKGQLTIPIELRDLFTLKKGERLEFIVLDSGEVVVQPYKVLSEKKQK